MSQIDHNLKLPKNLYLETTNRCNLKCRGCILYGGKREPERDISLKDFYLITDQLADLEQVTLHGVGEPLLNQDISAMVRHLKKRNVYTLFNSNGILLDHKRQHDLIRAGLDELRISLDAASAEGYKKIRNSHDFDRIVQNLRSLKNLQKAQSLIKPKLSLWFLGTKDNISEISEFVKLAADIKIREVYLQRLVYFQDDEGYGLARGDMSLHGSNDEAPELIQKSQELAASLGIQFNASGLCLPTESIRHDSAAAMPWRKCYRPQTLMYITANGNVLPCCIAPFATVDYAALILGNVFESSLEKIWLGAGYKNFRNQLKTADPPTCCQACGVLWSL